MSILHLQSKLPFKAIIRHHKFVEIENPIQIQINVSSIVKYIKQWETLESFALNKISCILDDGLLLALQYAEVVQLVLLDTLL